MVCAKGQLLGMGHINFDACCEGGLSEKKVCVLELAKILVRICFAGREEVPLSR